MPQTLITITNASQHQFWNALTRWAWLYPDWNFFFLTVSDLPPPAVDRMTGLILNLPKPLPIILPWCMGGGFQEAPTRAPWCPSDACCAGRSSLACTTADATAAAPASHTTAVGRSKGMQRGVAVKNLLLSL